jgi:hypothetical protein
MLPQASSAFAYVLLETKARNTMATNGMTSQIGYTRIVGWIQSIINTLLAKAPDNSAESTERLEFASARATHLFAQALHENSNLELDWLWYATNMTSAVERRYCINRALAINPHSSLARSALAKLPKPAEAAGEVGPLSRAAGASERSYR